MSMDLQRLLAMMAAPESTAVVLMSGAVLTLLVGVIRRRRAFVSSLPGAAFAVLAATLYFPLSPALASWRPAAIGFAGLALLIQFGIEFRAPADSREVAAGAVPASLVYLTVALGLAATLLFHALGDYAGTLQRWEASVVHGFAEAFFAGETVVGHALQRFVWNNGILSLGDQSLFFGAPTYALFHAVGFSAWTLRLAAVGATLINVVMLYVLARRFFGPLVGAAASMLLALNECVLFYGRYGSSPAGTTLAVLAAVACTWAFLERDRPGWWLGPACAATFYLATLQYAPGRLVVLILLAFIPLVLVCQWRRLSPWRMAGMASIAAGALGVWMVEGARARGLFLFGQGEQFFYMTKFPDYVASFCPSCSALRPDDPAYRFELLRRWLAITVPEYLSALGPSVQNMPLRDWDAPVFPHLYYGPLSLFLVWGFAHSLRRWKRPLHACLVVWLCGATVPLLLTNRVDAHRTTLFVIPLTLWSALGVWEAARLMVYAGVPRCVQHALGVALCLTVLAHDLRLLWGPSPAVPAAARALTAEIDAVPGPVAVGALIDPANDTLRDFEFVELHMLERQRRDPARTAAVLPYPLLVKIGKDGATPAEADVEEIERIAGASTLLLVPADVFRPVANAIRARGARLRESGTASLPILRLEMSGDRRTLDGVDRGETGFRPALAGPTT